MLKQRILQTLKFFNLQDYPLTLLELQAFLIADLQSIKPLLNQQWEVEGEGDHNHNYNDNNNYNYNPVGVEEILKCLDSQCQAEVENLNGFYFLRGRREIAEQRLQNYGINREKLIKKYIGFLRFLPFVRGVGLTGSQALGQQKHASDIDLLVITDQRFLWLARTLVTAYFQLLGRRRHGKKIQNRFCLNHYIAAPKQIRQHKNLYTALEYAKLRPLVYGQAVGEFVSNNLAWIRKFFPNLYFSPPEPQAQAAAQKMLENVFSNHFGAWLEQSLKNWQLPKIRVEEKFIVVSQDELSFHPDSKQEGLLENFFTAL